MKGTDVQIGGEYVTPEGLPIRVVAQVASQSKIARFRFDNLRENSAWGATELSAINIWRPLAEHDADVAQAEEAVAAISSFGAGYGLSEAEAKCWRDWPGVEVRVAAHGLRFLHLVIRGTKAPNGTSWSKDIPKTVHDQLGADIKLRLGRGDPRLYLPTLTALCVADALRPDDTQPSALEGLLG